MVVKSDERKNNNGSSNKNKNSIKKNEFSKKNSYNKSNNKERIHSSTNYGGFNKKNTHRFRQADVDESIDDIKADILRVEKEINLLIDEIKSMKL